MNVAGVEEVSVQHKNINKLLHLYDVHSEWLRQVGILYNCKDNFQITYLENHLNQILSKYKNVFNKDMVQIKGLWARLNLKANVQRFYIKSRTVTALLQELKKNLTS